MILYLDTSTEICRIWLNDKPFEKTLARKMARDTLGFLEEILREESLTWREIDGLAVFSGPGSFTGLRIGITIFNTLADSLKIPIVGAHNSDFSKTGAENSTDDWRKNAFEKLKNGENEKMALPFYGAEANITKPRK